MKEIQAFYEKQNLDIRKLQYEHKLLKAILRIKKVKGYGKAMESLRRRVRTSEFPEIVEEIMGIMGTPHIRLNGALWA